VPNLHRADVPYPLESLFGRILTPFEHFLHRTTAGSIVLVATTAATLLAASFFDMSAMHEALETPFSIARPEHALRLTAHEWINDGLMTLFFLVVGLELKREILVGELASPRQAVLPVVAAVGGMVVPALLYLCLNAGGRGAAGWGVPMATDIAFAVGILVMLSWRVPRNLIVFLTALAIADDLGAVLVIAFFYTAKIDATMLGASAGIFALQILLNRAGVRRPWPYVTAGIVLWSTLHASGLHATLAGIFTALAIPARPAVPPARFVARLDELRAALTADLRDANTSDDPLGNRRMAAIAEALESSAVAVQSPLQRIEHRLAPWVTFGVIPLFAFSNAGIDLSAVAWSEALESRVTLGVALGLVLGKFSGISLFCWIAVRARLAQLPTGVSWPQLLGAAWLAGIGFTMSLFVSQLAFKDASLVEQARLGILVASAISAVVGASWLIAWGRRAPAPLESGG
jgi:NhaA family Na+:H+ antiporter